jgi:putative flippase GtrA
MASVLALVVDLAVLLMLAQWTHYLVAATIGFALGAWVSYQIAVQWVFSYRSMENAPGKEFSAYLAVGLAGLAVNNLVILGAVEVIGASLLVAKCTAAMVTFVFNFGVRKILLFRRSIA